jgi:hypothetical protein
VNRGDSRQGPYGPMDKAPAYGAGDSGFESQYGLFFVPSSTIFVFFLLRCFFSPTAGFSLFLSCFRPARSASTGEEGDEEKYQPRSNRGGRGQAIKKKRGGDTGIEPVTSCTRSRNHTTRPITRWRRPMLAGSKVRDVLELNQRPIGLQPIALPLS